MTTKSYHIILAAVVQNNTNHLLRIVDCCRAKKKEAILEQVAGGSVLSSVSPGPPFLTILEALQPLLYILQNRSENVFSTHFLHQEHERSHQRATANRHVYVGIFQATTSYSANIIYRAIIYFEVPNITYRAILCFRIHNRSGYIVLWAT